MAGCGARSVVAVVVVAVVVAVVVVVVVLVVLLLVQMAMLPQSDQNWPPRSLMIIQVAVLFLFFCY